MNITNSLSTKKSKPIKAKLMEDTQINKQLKSASINFLKDLRVILALLFYWIVFIFNAL